MEYEIETDHFNVIPWLGVSAPSIHYTLLDLIGLIDFGTPGWGGSGGGVGALTIGAPLGRSRDVRLVLAMFSQTSVCV